jgi:DNA primase catalytic core
VDLENVAIPNSIYQTISSTHNNNLHNAGDWMYINNLEEVIHQLEDKLEEYLQSFGINTSANFSCISPDHDDKNPSCGIQGNNKKTFHCFSCNCSGNLFQAANYLENLPVSGKEFVSITIPTLAEKFGIEMSKREPTEAERYELETYQAYQIAAEYIVNSPVNKKVQDAIAERGWSTELCQNMKIGGIESYKAIRDHLRASGFSATFLDEIDLGRRKRGTQLLDENNLLFTISDEHGRPVGFACRNLDFDGDKSKGSKFVNQVTTGLKCNIYKKGSRLYGFDHVIRKYRRNKQPVWVFEGYSDIATARQNGLESCVGLGGLAFTQEQLYLLKEHGFYKLVLAFDGDKYGQERMADVLDKIIGGHKDIDVKIVVIPEQKDPDKFIRDKGIEEFMQLEQWNAFEWRLMQFAEDEDEVICAAMVPLIVNEPSCIKQDKMMKQLAKATGIDLVVINHEVSRLQDEREHTKSRDRKDILDLMWNKISRNPGEAELFMSEAQGNLYDLMKQYNKENLSADSYLSKLQQQKQKQEAKSDEFSGFVLDKDLRILQNVLNGEWKRDIFGVCGGRANSGKTSFLVRLAYSIASQDENNAIVIYHSIDDTLEQILPKFVCVAEGSKEMEINEVINPNYYAKQCSDIYKRRERGYELLQNLGQNQRLIIKDGNDGQSLAFVESLLRYYREKFPEKNIVFFLDNFHKLKDLAQSNADTQVYKAMSHRMKNMAGQYHAAIICTVEYTKMEYGTKPTNNNLSGTVQLEYDANLVWHLYSQFHEKGDKATDYHTTEKHGRLIKMPRIEINFGKNKVTNFRSKLYANFYPASSDFVMVDSDIAEADRQDKQGEQQPRIPEYM